MKTELKKSAYILILFLTVLTGCKKNPVLSDLNGLLSFKLEAIHNEDFFKKDIDGIIEGSTITLTIPRGVDITTLIATFSHNGKRILANGTEQKSAFSQNDFSKALSYIVEAENGNKATYSIHIEWKAEIPHLYIVTNGSAPITSKDNYLNASLVIDGKGIYEDYEGTTGIRGRGNSTWGLPKKPYRLKLDKKTSLFGLKEEKDWVLLANYLDETLMLNAVAMKIGQQLQMPYTNTIIPVEITINGIYLGSYMFTEQVEVEKTRIDIEDGGTLLELDTYFDEDWKFRSNFYELPVMIKYPDLEDSPIDDANTELSKIAADFHRLEDAISSTGFPNTNYLEYLDIEAFVNYFIVYDLTANEEINHPKSTYIRKPKNGKYMMGPIWDFDWAFSFDGNNSHFHSYNAPLVSNDMTRIGSRFFSRLLTDPQIKALYKTKWTSYKNSKLPALLKYIDDYAALISESKQRDYDVWKNGSANFQADIIKLKSWINGRANYIDSYVNSL